MELAFLTVCALLQSGQLNEYTERKDMSADVVCMGLGRVPPGEQRCRFLAVGLSDSTVRIISLDPNVSTIYKNFVYLILSWFVIPDSFTRPFMNEFLSL